LYAKSLIAFITLIVFILSTHVNVFMGFFYIADRFPFVLSIFTAVALGLTTVLDYAKSGNVITSRPSVELSLLGLYFISWTTSNAVSTPRWDGIQPGACSKITIGSNPSFESGTRTWCREIVALRALVWIEWLLVAGSFVFLLSYCIKQARRGASHIWTTPLAVFQPETTSNSKWNARNRAFSALSFRDRYGGEAGPYPFEMEAQTRSNSNPNNSSTSIRHTNTRSMHTSSMYSQNSVPAVLRDQIDPFYVSKERRLSIPQGPSSNEEAPTEPVTWRTFADQGFNKSNVSVTTQRQQQYQHHQRGYSTSIEQRPYVGYAM